MKMWLKQMKTIAKKYKVVKLENMTEFNIGEVLEEAEVRDLIQKKVKVTIN